MISSNQPDDAWEWTLITVAYNSADDLRRFWSDLELPAGAEWVVVDNASSDDSVAVARELGARVIASPRNIGFGAANNLGFSGSSSRYVGFVNPDVRVKPETLSQLSATIDKTGGLVSPQLVNSDGSLQPNGRGYPFLAEKIRNRFGDGDGASVYRRFAADGEDLPVIWFMGAVVLGLRTSLAELGPWDERFFVYYEDSDLGLRAAAKGYSRIVTGKVRWEHGWARETTKPELGPWKLEISSMVKFYSRYPRLLSPMSRLTGRRLEAKGWPTR